MSNAKQMFAAKLSRRPQRIKDAITDRVREIAEECHNTPIGKVWAQYIGLRMLISIEDVENIGAELFSMLETPDDREAPDDPNTIKFVLKPTQKLSWAQMPPVVAAIIEYERQGQEAPFVEAAKETYAALRSGDARRLEKADGLYHKYLTKQKSIGPPGKTLIKMGDWEWVDLNCSYSHQEGRAGGHCGNVARRDGDNIYSLRDGENRVHATFVIDKNGYLVEMKGRFNKTPTKTADGIDIREKLIPLLQQPFVKGMRPHSRYNNGQDLEFTQLTPHQQAKVIRKNPALRDLADPEVQDLFDPQE